MSDDIARQVAGFDDASTEPGVWRYAHARRVRVVIDGEDYFDLIQQAMLKARQRILLIGWDFDTRVHLSRGRRWWQRPTKGGYPSRLGSFVAWLVRKQRSLEVRILKWNYSALIILTRGAMVFDLLRWLRHPRIGFKLDDAHPTGCTHHQKIVVIDDDFAVCGGIDMTGKRWDTREHRPDDKRREDPDGPYEPWHDITMMMEGDVAGELDRLARARWVRAGGKPLAAPTPTGESAWPDDLVAHFENVEVGIARTVACHAEHCEVREIEALFMQHIARAKRFIYAESQYFASRKIAEAIARRLEEDDPPEFVIVHPVNADGWIEQQAMDPARDALASALVALDKHQQFHLYSPYHGKTPIYVHAKLLIVDDEVLRIGSANFNNRSLGLDSECDVFIDAARPANAHAGPAITAIRHSLLAEHLGMDEAEVPDLLERCGSMAALIALKGDLDGRNLHPFHAQEGEGVVAEMSAREMLDPESPDQMFAVTDPGRGLFRRGSLLAKARERLSRKRRARK